MHKTDSLYFDQQNKQTFFYMLPLHTPKLRAFSYVAYEQAWIASTVY